MTTRHHNDGLRKLCGDGPRHSRCLLLEPYDKRGISLIEAAVLSEHPSPAAACAALDAMAEQLHRNGATWQLNVHVVDINRRLVKRLAPTERTR